MSFDTLGLSEALVRAVKKAGYNNPTPIQKKAIPAILDGHDMMAAAQTGTGKTAGFTLPLLEILSDKRPRKVKQTRSLIITPTRELAAQVEACVIKYGSFLKLKSAVVYGGVSIRKHIKQLEQGVDILVATPGRLLDLHRQGAINFDSVEMLVLDEADRMLDMGFLPDIKTILNGIPNEHQRLLFSATFSDNIRKLARTILYQPLEVSVAPRNVATNNVNQYIIPVDKARKLELLQSLLKDDSWFQVLVFSRTKHGADKLVKKLLKNNISAAAIHGNKTQSQRTQTLKAFKQNKVRVLVATDIAARGIDVQNLSHVINFDLPQVSEDYVHRIGRTGRAGASGEAISLVSADEAEILFSIEKLLKTRLKREEIEGFEPTHSVPEGPKRKKPQSRARRKKPNSTKKYSNARKQSKRNKSPRLKKAKAV